MTVSTCLLALCIPAAAAETRTDYPITPVKLTKVKVSGGLWASRLATNRKATLPYAFRKCEETGRISNFAKAGQLIEGQWEGLHFNDSDVYKVVEGAAYCLATHPDAKLDKYVDGVIAKIAAAQQEDGYLHPFISLTGRDPRWKNPRRHELYSMGHLIEAGAVHYEMTGKRTLLDVAIRLADHIDGVFDLQGDTLRRPPEHQQLEIGLVRLYRVTGQKKYLDLARAMLDLRGRGEGRKLYGAYAQDHRPVVEQTEAVGHAVRAGYQYTGMADVAALTGDSDYRQALDRLWQNVVGKKLYITGGIGARRGGEAFGEAYQLPNEAAYCETCAAIANALWNHRMFLLHGEAKYLDVLERVLYNGFLSGVSLEGTTFFYPNPLTSHGKHARSTWFGCACCPSNIVRFVPRIPGYAYAHRDEQLYVNLFMAGEADVDMAGGGVRVKQKTNYPWDGKVKITVEPDVSGREFALNVRIPGWARERPVPSDLYRYLNRRDDRVVLKINGEPATPEMHGGFARLRRAWHKGDVLEVDLPMPIRRVLCNERVAENRGRVALERGPVVYCLEWPDNAAGHVLNLVIPDDAPLESQHRADLLGGVTVISGRAEAISPGGPDRPVVRRAQPFVAIPCYAWAHRGQGEMTVWPARLVEAAEPLSKQ